MNKLFRFTIINLAIVFSYGQVLAQTNNVGKKNELDDIYESNHPLYVAHPNHKEIVQKTFSLALNAGFLDTLGITEQEIRDRLEAGAYSEDFESIPGIIGEHFPAPWNSGPTFDFNGLYPFTKIPYGNYIDSYSGWYRGLNHGFDPVQEFNWPGAETSTVDWANHPSNSFIWDKVIDLYNAGNKAEAYECLGHILHLLADLSIPSHVKVVDHGTSINRINSGTIIDPDLLGLIVDEYEIALSGGIPLPGIIYIPNLLNDFRSALDSSKVNNIPIFNRWEDYLKELGLLTYNHSIVNQYYTAPSLDGEWGSALNDNGIITEPTQYGITPPVELNGRWFQITLKSTANSNGTIIPEADMITMCNYLVPKAVEYGVGLLMYFHRSVTEVNDVQFAPEEFVLQQNYPNPFNPSTTIKFSLPSSGYTTLKIYNSLGQEVAVLINKELTTGTSEVEWNASSLPSGIYFYQLKTESYAETRKMILIK